MDTKRLHLTCLQYSQKTYISNTTSILLLCVFSRQRQSAEGFSAAPNCFVLQAVSTSGQTPFIGLQRSNFQQCLNFHRLLSASQIKALIGSTDFTGVFTCLFEAATCVFLPIILIILVISTVCLCSNHAPLFETFSSCNYLLRSHTDPPLHCLNLHIFETIKKKCLTPFAPTNVQHKMTPLRRLYICIIQLYFPV